MIDSSCRETLYDVIQQFREYITQNHGSDSQTAQAYLRIADDFQMHVKDKEERYYRVFSNKGYRRGYWTQRYY